MSATAAMIAELRRMTAEPTTATYDDDALTVYVERYPLLDELGQTAYAWDYSTTPPSEDANEEWIPTYDLYAAAADIWLEKAALVHGNFDFAADGANFSRSQHYTHCMTMHRRCQARRSPTTITQVVEPRRASSDTYPLNAPEVD